jgi:ABC-2 type transport system permease protein
MYGSGARLDGSIGTYMEWRVLGFGLVFAALWGIFVGTRLFRQDEETGRQEHVLARNTTPTRTFVLSLSVTMGAVVLQVVIAAVSLLLANKTDGVHFGIAEVVLFSTTMLSASVLFIGFSALFSQLFNTRRRALLWSGVLTIFCFGIRAFVATKNNATWATYVSPFDWMQNVHPLSGYRLAWFIPTVSLTAALLLTAGILNHKRDMGEGVLKSNDIARRRSRLLSSSLSSSMFFMRASIAIWGVSTIGFTMFLATLAHTAQDALKGSSGAFQERVSSVLQTQTDTVVRLFLGMAFFIATVLLLTAVAGFVIALKNEESQGYLDAILVRPQSRSRWLIERVSIIVAASAITAVLSGVAAYFVLPVGVDVPAIELVKAF